MRTQAGSAKSDAIETGNNIRVIPEETATDWPAERRIYSFSDQRPVDALDQALLAIAAHYGDRTTGVVAMQLEYPQ